MRVFVVLVVVAAAFVGGKPVLAQSCASPAPFEHAYLQFMMYPQLPLGLYDLMEITVTPLEWKSGDELDADNNPQTSGRFRMLALYFDMSSASGEIADFYSVAGNLKIHNNSGEVLATPPCGHPLGQAKTRIYSSTLFHSTASRGHISESIPSAPFRSTYDSGEGTDETWNSFYEPSASPSYPEGSPLTLRIEREGGVRSGSVTHIYPQSACSPVTVAGEYFSWEISADTAHNGRKNALGEHHIFRDRGEVIRYSRGLQFEVFQADCLRFSPVHLVVESIRVRTLEGAWLSVESGMLDFFHYGIADQVADCRSPQNSSYDYRFGAYAEDGKLHLRLGHDGDERYQRCGALRWGDGPQVPVGAVVNAASFAGPVSPGSLMSLFGQNLASATVLATTLPLPTTLGGAAVTLNGEPAPLLVVTPTQINAQVPVNLVPGTPSAVVTTASGSSQPVGVTVTDVAPAIFTLTAGSGQAVVIHTDGSLAARRGAFAPHSSRPARAGETVIILATGLGGVTPAVLSGRNSQDELRYTVTTPDVLLGGLPASVRFSGLSPEFVGVNQLNVIVPAGIAPGDAVSVQLRMGGITTSDRVTMAVEAPPAQ